MIPDYCEAITAYRAWDVHQNGLLVGQAHGEPWPPYQAFVARCGRGSHHHVVKGQWIAPPVWKCECGIYALRTYEAAEARVKPQNGYVVTFGFNPLTGAESRHVWGSVKLWGRIIEHVDGFRAEYAYPSELWCENEQLARTVARLYGVPCGVKTFPKPVSVEAADIWDIFKIPTYLQSAPFSSPRGILSWSDAPSTLPPSAPILTPRPVPTKLLSRWQQREANKPVPPEQDWREILKQGLYVQKDKHQGSYAAQSVEIVFGADFAAPTSGAFTPILYGTIDDSQDAQPL